jgi:hypothetical protein
MVFVYLIVGIIFMKTLNQESVLTVTNLVLNAQDLMNLTVIHANRLNIYLIPLVLTNAL